MTTHSLIFSRNRSTHIYNTLGTKRFVQPGQFDDAEEDTVKEVLKVQASLPTIIVSQPAAIDKPTHVPDCSSLIKLGRDPSVGIDDVMIKCASFDEDATAGGARTDKPVETPPVTKKVLTKLQTKKDFLSARVTMSKAAKSKRKVTNNKKSLGVIGVYHWRWLMNFRELSLFRKEKGHCRVPQHYPANPKLGTWVHNQRQKYKLGVLTEERMDMLRRLDFQWEVARGGEKVDYPSHGRLKNWEMMFSEMSSFHDTHGHCNVPNTSSAQLEYSLLLKWANVQRYWYRKYIAGYKSKLSRERVERLESIGFSWGRFSA